MLQPTSWGNHEVPGVFLANFLPPFTKLCPYPLRIHSVSSPYPLRTNAALLAYFSEGGTELVPIWHMGERLPQCVRGQLCESYE